MVEKVSAILTIGTKIKDAIKSISKLRELRKENIKLHQEIVRLERHVKDLEVTIQTQSERIKELEDITKQPFKQSFSCPTCNIGLTTEIPYQRLIGVHKRNGAPSMRTRRGTLEIELECPQCHRLLHVDFK